MVQLTRPSELTMSKEIPVESTSSGCSASYSMQAVVPPEIIITVFGSMDWRTLVRCTIVSLWHFICGIHCSQPAKVCRFWQHLIRDTLSVQYKIELGADGMDDGPPGGVPVAERMQALQRRRQAWRTLGFSRIATVPMPGECHAYELVGGIFAKAMIPQHDLTTPGNLLGSRHLSLVALPSATSEPRTLVREDIGLSCRDFGIDPTQDLIALVEQPTSYVIST